MIRPQAAVTGARDIDSVFTLEDAARAFARSMAADKRGKVVLEVAR